MLNHFWAKRISNNLQKRSFIVSYVSDDESSEEQQVVSEQKEILLRKFEDQAKKNSSMLILQDQNLGNDYKHRVMIGTPSDS